MSGLRPLGRAHQQVSLLRTALDQERRETNRWKMDTISAASTTLSLPETGLDTNMGTNGSTTKTTSFQPRTPDPEERSRKQSYRDLRQQERVVEDHLERRSVLSLLEIEHLLESLSSECSKLSREVHDRRTKPSLNQPRRDLVEKVPFVGPVGACSCSPSIDPPRVHQETNRDPFFYADPGLPCGAYPTPLHLTIG